MLVETIESFDVFDTLLTRCVLKPSDLYLLIGRRLSELGLVSSAEDFYRERMAAERRAREVTSREEVTLNEIYSILASSFGWTHYMVERAIRQEITCERETLVPVAAMRKAVETAHSQGRKVLYISDTYLPGDFILEQLQACFPIDQSTLYTSSEVGLTKHSGRLFSHISGIESILYNQWCHHGDNPHSDVRIPRELGIESKLVDHSPTRYEASVAESSQDILARTLSGCMRATRLSYSFDSIHYQSLWNLTCNVIAPAFFGFCYWLLSSALRDGVRRLYFLARDGQILLKIARIIQETVPAFNGIECRYLYGSRQAWHLPSVFRVDTEALNWIFANTSFLSVDVILTRSGNVEHELSPGARNAICACIPQQEWSNNLPDSDRLRLRRVFEENEDIHKWIQEGAEQVRKSTIQYFKQEELMDGTEWAMVDIGWGGNLQNSLSRMLTIVNGASRQSVRGYYWGLRTKKPYHPDDKQIAFADELSDRWRHVMFCYVGLYEIFASADHGSTIGYYETTKGWKPVLRDTGANESINWGVHHLHEGAVAFSCNLIRNWKWELPLNQYMSLVLPILEKFFIDPTDQEVACLEAKAMYECQTEAAPLSLVPEGNHGRGVVLKWLIGLPVPQHGVWFHAVISKQPIYFRTLFRILLHLHQIVASVSHGIKRFTKTFILSGYQ
jgi:hypothetical protein